MERRGFLAALVGLPFMKWALPKASTPLPIPIAEDGKPLFYNCNSGNLYQYTETSNGDVISTWVKIEWQGNAHPNCWKLETKA